MGVFSVLKRLFRLTVEAFILILLITFLPGLPPDVNISQSWKIEKVTLEGKLSLNDKLDGIEHLFKDQIHGPESFADDNDFVYTSLHLGDIVKIAGKHMVPIVKFGKPCKGVYQEEICGRPLGLAFGKDGYLYAADAYYGIFKVNVKTGAKVELVSINQEIDGRKIKIPNSLAVACNGDIYWTDSDSNFSLQDGVFSFFGDASGRLFHYNVKTRTNEVLLDNLHFANGVKLSSKEDYVIVSETNRNRIHRVYLKGPKKGTNDIFISNLPGMPDNIQTDGSSGFIVGIVQDVHSKNPCISQMFSQFPNIRKFFVRSLALIELAFKTINRIYPNELAQKGMHFVGHLEPLSSIPSKTAVLHISENGEILDCLWGNSKIVGKFSEAHIVKDHLYLGSPFNKHLGRIPLSQIGWEHLRQKTDSLTATKQRCMNLNEIVESDGKDVKMPNIAAEKPTITKSTPKPMTISTTPRHTTKSTTSKPVTSTELPKKPATTSKPVPTTSKPSPTTQEYKTTSTPTTVTPKRTVTNSNPPADASKPPTTEPKPPSSVPQSASAPKPTSKSTMDSSKQVPAAKPSAPSTKPPAPANKFPAPSTKPPTPPTKPLTAAPNTNQDPPEAPKPAQAIPAPTPSISSHFSSETVEPKKEVRKTAPAPKEPKLKEDLQAKNSQKTVKIDSQEANIRSLKNEL